jgi:prepilin-type N-terminal cleavage/methylation domain-containing protein
MERVLCMRIFGKMNSAGFTMAEVMTVISVAGILAAIGIPAFTRTLPGLRLTDAARQVATELQHVRMKAIEKGISQQITFSTSSYVLQQCNGTCTDDGGNIALPTGITATAATAPRFEPRGTVNTASAITLSNGTAQKFVCVKTIGRVNIQDSACS